MGQDSQMALRVADPVGIRSIASNDDEQRQWSRA
jgi:hypothetical protein